MTSDAPCCPDVLLIEQSVTITHDGTALTRMTCPRCGVSLVTSGRRLPADRSSLAGLRRAIEAEDRPC